MVEERVESLCQQAYLSSELNNSSKMFSLFKEKTMADLLKEADKERDRQILTLEFRVEKERS